MLDPTQMALSKLPSNYGFCNISLHDADWVFSLILLLSMHFRCTGSVDSICRHELQKGTN